jgi:hypothetical protein
MGDGLHGAAISAVWDGYRMMSFDNDIGRKLTATIGQLSMLLERIEVLEAENAALRERLAVLETYCEHPTTEDVKRWFQLLVGKGESAMVEDMQSTYLSVDKAKSLRAAAQVAADAGERLAKPDVKYSERNYRVAKAAMAVSELRKFFNATKP